MTRKTFLEGLAGGSPPHRPINVASPGNTHLILCVCGHEPDKHDAQAGCIELVEVVDEWSGGDRALGQDFCHCGKYQVAP